MQVPRGRAELLSRDTSTPPLVHSVAGSCFEDFSWETATSLQNEGGEGKEQVAEEPRVTGYLSCVLVLEGEGVR